MHRFYRPVLALVAPLLLILALGTAGCRQNDDNQAVPQGTVRFTNTSILPFQVFVNNEYIKEVPGQSFYERKMDAGVYVLRAQQVNSSPPVIKETTTAVANGSFYEFVFP
jgi:hypothetical protein